MLKTTIIVQYRVSKKLVLKALEVMLGRDLPIALSTALIMIKIKTDCDVKVKQGETILGMRVNSLK